MDGSNTTTTTALQSTTLRCAQRAAALLFAGAALFGTTVTAAPHAAADVEQESSSNAPPSRLLANESVNININAGGDDLQSHPTRDLEPIEAETRDPAPDRAESDPDATLDGISVDIGGRERREEDVITETDDRDARDFVEARLFDDVAESDGAAGAPEHDAASYASEHLPLGREAGLFTFGRAGGGTSASDDVAVGGLSRGAGEFSRIAGALAVVLGLLLLGFMLMKRLGATGGLAVRAGRPSGVLEILARYPLGRGQSLIVLKLDRRILLLHQNRSVMTTLTELSNPAEVASLLARIEAGSREHGGGMFQRLLQSAGEKHIRGAGDVETVDLTRAGPRGFFRNRQVPA